MGSQILERGAVTRWGFRSAWYIDIWNNWSILFFLAQKWCFTKGNAHTSVFLPVQLLKDHAFIWVAALRKENWRSGIMMLYPKQWRKCLSVCYSPGYFLGLIYKLHKFIFKFILIHWISWKDQQLNDSWYKK